MKDGITITRKILGFLIFFVGGGYVFIVELIMVYSLMGFWGFFLGFFLFPGVFAIMPFVAIFIFGNWLLLILTILIPVVGMLLMADTSDL